METFVALLASSKDTPGVLHFIPKI